MGPEASQALSKPKYYIPGLDGVRGLAIILVLLSHSVIYDQFSWFKGVGLEAGYMGVAVFFTLSGYLITKLLLQEEQRTGRISLRLFYLRRSVRLFPALWVYLAVLLGLWFFGFLPDHPWHSLVSSLLYIRNLVGHGHETDHLWSLAIEEQFYLLWPLLVVALPRLNRIRLLLALTILAGVAAWRCYAVSNALASPGALYIRSDFRFDAPLIGCVLALTGHVAPTWAASWNATPFRSDVLASAGLVGIFLWLGLHPDGLLFLGLKSTAMGLLGALLVCSQTGARGWIGTPLRWRPLVLLGQISYGVYLWQQLFLGPCSAPFEQIRTFPIGLFATFLVAITSYHFLESPLLQLKDRLLQNNRHLQTGKS